MNEKRQVLQLRIDNDFEKTLLEGMRLSGIKNKSDFIRMCVNKYLNDFEINRMSNKEGK